MGLNDLYVPSSTFEIESLKTARKREDKGGGKGEGEKVRGKGRKREGKTRMREGNCFPTGTHLLTFFFLGQRTNLLIPCFSNP